ncbi:maltooligosyl trehalose hydrolase [Mucilaginibacter pineti]|uniref:Malto-oligosyltrehalose trehalohydrolase n=1 Tax=Mucilaginibacter pineti TaxID=1391627 RepID=A0A1G7H6S4_9SPHI|nr:malto-oligosyltrehalose trehalohydrolase [Mucilaginibacter pineti]SDE96140.1 maltooligosyl trehalose hydrolase [Mucilaginibacter pineti]
MDKVSIDGRKLGVNFNSVGKAEVLIWAPRAEKATIRIREDQDIELGKLDYGYWQLTTDEIHPGSRYRVILDDQEWPDIASLNQPDIHGPSFAFDLREFQWTDQQWQNIPLEDYIIYELHTGTFSPDGTFEGLSDKLDHLISLGITAIELMPVAQYPGNRNWGYDGVFPFAVQESYGGAAGLQKLVDTCHQKGLAVILDVVYNHIGPEGNYFEKYGPFFTDKYHTPWGNAINFDDAGCYGVRRFFTENALMWLRDFHIDALRMDAVHAIKDFSTKHILQEIKEYTEQLIKKNGRRHYLIVECDLNDPRFINPLSKAGFGMDAQWTDEFHHALRIASGGKKEGYYSDFNGIGDLAEAFNHGYVYYGRYSAQRDKLFGADPEENPGKQFVVFSQNHDQVGNRILGERSSRLFSFEVQKLMAATVLISPFLPMLFMGEEYCELNPFLYFVSHTDPELISAVRDGRRKEFAAFHSEGEAPDPQAEDTFNASKLNWTLLKQPPHKLMLNYYSALIALRKTKPALRTLDRQQCRATVDEESHVLIVRRRYEDDVVTCLLNFSNETRTVFLADHHNCRLIFNSIDWQWNGPIYTTAIIPDGPHFTLQPQSILILEQYV